MTMTIIKTCADSLGGLLRTYQLSGNDTLMLSVAESMLVCSGRRECDCHAVCAERAIEVYREAS